MVLVDLLKSVFGLGSDSKTDSTDGSQNGDGPHTENEAAVKGTDEAAAAETTSSGSTGSVTEEPPLGKPDEDDPVESAAEPAEAAGPQSQVDSEPDLDDSADVDVEGEESDDTDATAADAEDVEVDGDAADEDAEAEAHGEGSASLTEEPPSDEEATEPAEAAGPQSQVATDDDLDGAAEDTDAETHPEGSAAMTEEPPEDEAAEPAEAAGEVTDHAGTEEPAAEPAEAAGPTEGDDAAPELTDVSGVGPAYAKRLEDAGVETVAELAGADADELADATGVSEKRVGRWIESAQDV